MADERSTIERTLRIDASPEVVFACLTALRRQPAAVLNVLHWLDGTL